MTLLTALDGSFGDQPEAVSIAGVATSWADLRAASGRLASAMVGMPAVAVEAEPTLQTVVAVVAGLLAGVPVVPVPPDAGPLEREHILRDSGALPLPAAAGVERALPTPSPEVPALVMYTSGTTGAPKGVVMSGRAIAAGLDGLADAWQWTADDVLVHGLPLFHVHGLVLGVLGALRTGARLVHTGRPTPAGYAAAGGSLYFGVPTVWGRVCADPAAASALTGARLLVSGSAPLPVPVFDELQRLTGHAPVERYGMTETLITLSTRFDGERRPGWVGVPIAGVDTRLVDDHDTVAPHDGETIGELQVQGATMFDRYLNRPEATADSFAGDWFRTGDAAVIDASGFHRIVGRQSMDIIKSGGFKVGAGEVESCLLGHPSVREVAVVGFPDDDLGQRIVAFVVLDGVVGEEVDAALLIDHVATNLSVHKRPRDIHVVAELPRNAMGKVQKHLLR
ncbi:MAG: acyl-CoA synthetase [Actinobacteria bacterium]|nr:acyl-CoA synthetase [Actinomycetota bacterium]